MKKFFALIAMATMLSTSVAYADELPPNDVVTQEETKDSTVDLENTIEEVLPEINTSKKGSIKVTFEKIKEGLKVTAYKVADVIDGEYILVDAYKDSKIDLNNLEDTDSIRETISELETLAKDGVELTADKEGTLTFKDLEVGVYLIKTADDTEYDIVQSSLVSIPTFDDTSKDMNYDIEITAKTQERPIENETPQTGVSKSVFVFASVAFIATTVGILIGKGKKK